MNAGVVIIISINTSCAVRTCCAEGLIRQNTCLRWAPSALKGGWRGFWGPLAGLLDINGVDPPRLVQRHRGLEEEKTQNERTSV